MGLLSRDLWIGNHPSKNGLRKGWNGAGKQWKFLKSQHLQWIMIVRREKGYWFIGSAPNANLRATQELWAPGVPCGKFAN